MRDTRAVAAELEEKAATTAPNPTGMGGAHAFPAPSPHVSPGRSAVPDCPPEAETAALCGDFLPLAASPFSVSGTDIDADGDTGTWSFTLTVTAGIVVTVARHRVRRV